MFTRGNSVTECISVEHATTGLFAKKEEVQNILSKSIVGRVIYRDENPDSGMTTVYFEESKIKLSQLD